MSHADVYRRRSGVIEQPLFPEVGPTIFHIELWPSMGSRLWSRNSPLGVWRSGHTTRRCCALNQLARPPPTRAMVSPGMLITSTPARRHASAHIVISVASRASPLRADTANGFQVSVAINDEFTKGSSDIQPCFDVDQCAVVLRPAASQDRCQRGASLGEAQGPLGVRTCHHDGRVLIAQRTMASPYSPTTTKTAHQLGKVPTYSDDTWGWEGPQPPTPC